MSSARPKTPYTRDQRELSLLVYADSRGHTRARLEWRECAAGEDRKRSWELGRWEWPGAINTRQHAIWCLVKIARALADQQEPAVRNE